MNDTHPKIDHHYRQMLRSRTGEERLLMGDSMYETARRLVLASIKAKNPEANPVELRCALFLRFYGQEVSDAERRKILTALKRLTNSKGK